MDHLDRFFSWLNPKRAIRLLIAVGLIVYFNALFNSFVWDDEEQVVLNTLIYSIRNFPLFFKGSTFNPGGTTTLSGLYYKPLMTVFFSLIYTLFGPNPFFFHLFQILLNIANSILVFLILKHFFGANDQLPFFLSLIFLVHPINAEAVVYVSALQDILFFFFGMLALWLLTSQTRMSEPPPPDVTSGAFWCWGNTKISAISLFLFFSLLSKETGVFFIAAAFVYLFLFKKEILPKFLLSILPALAVYSFLRFALARIYFQKHGLSPITRMTLPKRLISVPQITLFYLRTFLFPQNLAISQHWVVKSINFSQFYLPLALVLLFFSGLVGLGIILWRQKFTIFKTFFFFFLWFVIGLGLHLQIFPLDLTVSERWFYLPMVGLLGVVGTAMKQSKIENQKLKAAGCLMAIFVAFALSIRTMARTFDWRDGLTLYSRDIKISKDSFDLENNLGVELFRASRFDKAKGHFEKSIKLAPHWWTNWNNLGAIFEREGKLDQAEKYYQKAIDNGNYYLAHENLAFLVLKTKQPKQAIEIIEKSAAVLPYNARVLTALTLAFIKEGQWEKAEETARRLFSLYPSPQNLDLLQAIIKRKEIKF